jgi:2-keto-myo-inositol isomerase
MLEKKRIGLNRIALPNAPLDEFFRFAASLGMRGVELRNDLPGRGIIDGFQPEKVRDLLEQHSLRTWSINALQRFNVASILPDLTEELRDLIEIAKSIGCEAIVLCPNNDPADTRQAIQFFAETVRALKTFGPLFLDSGLKGYIEPLGFRESSLRSKVLALKAIQEADYPVYRIVHDTFHHHIGPDAISTLVEEYEVAYTGLVHISGVEDALAVGEYRDEHRILVGEEDRLKSREQISVLLRLGYEGNLCFEPFSKEIQNRDTEDLKEAFRKSIDYLCG